VHPDIQTLLALQDDDLAIHSIESEMAGLQPRLTDLDRVRQVAADALDRAKLLVQSEEKRQHDLQNKLSEVKHAHERNLTNLDSVKKPKEAAAAMNQLETTRKLLADLESEVQATTRRVSEARAAVHTQEAALAELETSQAAVRAEIDRERGEVISRLKDARTKREGAAQRVARTLLSKYDRIRARKRVQALYPLRGPSCGNCDTAIPLQRRNIMINTGQVEMCEACGVLLYAAE
jgi:predicted  nucleic acid-binding Zn-ribbon protein